MNEPTITREYTCTEPCEYDELTDSCRKCGYLYHPCGVYTKVNNVRMKVIYVPAQKKEEPQ